jgi:Zn-dependent M28 family amino/carboxypeptidase
LTSSGQLLHDSAMPMCLSNEDYPVGADDHFSFIRRGIAACDIIDFDVQTTYWHTPGDTLDKVDPRSLAIVGHVFIETLPALEKKFP